MMIAKERDRDHIHISVLDHVNRYTQSMSTLRDEK